MSNHSRVSHLFSPCVLFTAVVLAMFFPAGAAAQVTAQNDSNAFGTMAPASDADAPRSDVDAIMKQSRRLSDAYVRGDIKELVSIYTSDGVAAPAGRDFIRGREALLSLWALPAGRTVLSHSATPVELTVDGSHAYDWGYYEGRAAQDGEPLDPFRGTYVIVWERGDDDVWRIAVDMWAGLRKPLSN